MDVLERVSSVEKALSVAAEQQTEGFKFLQQHQLALQSKLDDLQRCLEDNNGAPIVGSSSVIESKVHTPLLSRLANANAPAAAEVAGRQ